MPDKDAWAKLRSVAVMECRREVIGGKTSVERRYYISSMAGDATAHHLVRVMTAMLRTGESWRESNAAPQTQAA